jgi:hypothetical protein
MLKRAGSNVSKSSQRKGRDAEYEAARIAEPFDLKVRVHGIWEAHDISIEEDPYEVKRCEVLSIRRADDALEAGARGMISRCNRKPWKITVDFKDWLEDQRDLKRLRDIEIAEPIE